MHVFADGKEYCRELLRAADDDIAAKEINAASHQRRARGLVMTTGGGRAAMSGRRHSVARIALLIVAVAAVLYAFNLIISAFVPKALEPAVAQYHSAIVAAVVLVAGYLLITLLNRIIVRAVTPRTGKGKAVTIKYLFSLVAYLVLAFTVFGILHVDLSGLLVGSAFTAIVLGLASQTILANFFAGLVLVLARPVEAGERITFATWQFGVVAPAYPPKFFSNDFLISGYTGVIDYIGFLYVVVTLDDGRTVKVPAGIFMQALISINSRAAEFKVRTKYEIEKQIDSAAAIDAIRKEVSRVPLIVAGTSPEVFISETTLNTYILAIDVKSALTNEEQVRSEILQAVMKTVAALRQALGKGHG